MGIEWFIINESSLFQQPINHQPPTKDIRFYNFSINCDGGAIGFIVELELKFCTPLWFLISQTNAFTREKFVFSFWYFESNWFSCLNQYSNIVEFWTCSLALFKKYSLIGFLSSQSNGSIFIFRLGFFDNLTVVVWVFNFIIFCMTHNLWVSFYF